MAKSVEQMRAERAALMAAPKPAPPAASTNGAMAEPEAVSDRTLSRPVERERRAVRQSFARGEQPRVPPHDVQAEQGVLGSMLVDPVRCIPLAIRMLGPDFFYVAGHRVSFERLIEHFRETPKLDMSTFTLYLEQVGQLAEVGGPVFVLELFRSIPSAVNIEYYIGIVRDKKVLRDLASACNAAAAAVYDPDVDALALVGITHKAVEQVRLEASGESENVENFKFSDLLGFDPAVDPNILVGSGRWLCRGFTCLWAAAAGAGKSTLEMQLAIYWGCGLPCFGIKPARPVKSLIVQAENDLGDTGEQLQGVLEGIRKAGDVDVDGKRRALIEKNVVIKRVIGCTGDKFLALLESLIQTERPELVWIDPLFAFAGCDLKDAKETAHFIREGIIPIAVRTGVCIHVIHHVGKPDKDSAAKSGWTDLDFQYLGFGSSEMQNAFRAVNVMLPVSGEDRVFRLILSKRGGRAGAKDPDGEFTTNLYLTHAKEGICWLQVDKPGDPEQTKRKGQFIKSFTADDILAEMSVTDPMATGSLHRHVSTETGMSRATFYRLFDDLKKTEKIQIEGEGWVKKTSVPHGKSHGVSS